MSEIIIIGAGITGCAAAHALGSEGHRVTLIDKTGIAAMASGLTLAGVRQSGRDPAELPLARAAVARWAELRDVLGVDVDYCRGGNLRLARNDAEVAVIRALVDRQRALGLELSFLANNADVRAIAPSLSRSVLAASFCPSDGHADPVKATRAFAMAAQRRGVDVREGRAALSIAVTSGKVTGVDTTDGFLPADAVIVAAGINTPVLLAPLALSLPLSVKVVSVVQTAPFPGRFEPVFGVANADCAGRQQLDGCLRVTTGLGDWPGDPAHWSAAALEPSHDNQLTLLHRIAQLLPGIGGLAIRRAWGGLIDLTPDALPVIDAPPSVRGLVVAAGFSGHGFGLGPITGQLAADLALGRTPKFDISAFTLSRLSGLAATGAALSLHG